MLATRIVRALRWPGEFVRAPAKLRKALCGMATLRSELNHARAERYALLGKMNSERAAHFREVRALEDRITQLVSVRDSIASTLQAYATRGWVNGDVLRGLIEDLKKL